MLDGYSSFVHIGSVPDGYSRLRLRLCARPIIVGFRGFSVAITHSRRMDRWHQYIRASFATGIVASYRCSLGIGIPFSYLASARTDGQRLEGSRFGGFLPLKFKVCSSTRGRGEIGHRFNKSYDTL